MVCEAFSEAFKVKLYSTKRLMIKDYTYKHFSVFKIHLFISTRFVKGYFKLINIYRYMTYSIPK